MNKFTKSTGTMLGENIFILTLILLIFGLYMVFDASAVTRGRPDFPYYLASKQLTWDLIGLCFFAFIYLFVSLRNIKLFAPVIMITALLFLLAVLLMGQEINGARRWFRWGFISFQPSEFAKIAAVIFMAYLLERKQGDLTKLKRGVLPCMGFIILPISMIALAPDMGNALLLFVILMAMMFVAGVRIKHIIYLAVITLPVAAMYGYQRFDHVKARISAFLNPGEDLMGKGYQAFQALIALGSGGLFGKGSGQGLQKMYYLPEAHNDFIFAIIGEDLGLIGCTALLVLYMLLIWYAVQVCQKATDLFGLLLAFGIISLFAGQVLFNIGVVTNLLPNKGISLPLISYGGSNALFTLIGLGILCKITQSIPPDRPVELGATRLDNKNRPLF